MLSRVPAAARRTTGARQFLSLLARGTTPACGTTRRDRFPVGKAFALSTSELSRLIIWVLQRSQNSRASRSERSPETTSSLRSGRSRGASIGTGSLTSGRFLDYAGSNATEYFPGCARNDVPQFGNFEIAYSTRRMTVDAVLGQRRRRASGWGSLCVGVHWH